MSTKAQSPIRPIDHLVIAVRDLASAREAYGRLGFTLTPEAKHPFGTSNSLVQLHGGFLELLAVTDEDRIAEPAGDAFSFAAFNRDYLEAREGISMLALKSDDPAADRADFGGRGMPVYAPFRFERKARAPDGEEKEVAFSLTFTGDRRIRDAGFFTCHSEHPDNFWTPAYQTHANGATRIEAVVMVARDPADFHEFFFYLTGQHDMRADSLTVTLDPGGGVIDLLTRVAVDGFYGVQVEPNPRPRFVAMRIAVPSLAAVRDLLDANGVPYREILGRVVVPPTAACGAALAFSEAV